MTSSDFLLTMIARFCGRHLLAQGKKPSYSFYPASPFQQSGNTSLNLMASPMRLASYS